MIPWAYKPFLFGDCSESCMILRAGLQAVFPGARIAKPPVRWLA